MEKALAVGAIRPKREIAVKSKISGIVKTSFRQVGDVVTFYLKYSNNGGKPIDDVAVSDSLTGRLEYVPGSAQASRNVVFTTQVNEAGSMILRWEVTGELMPGQHGYIRFQARVR